MPISPRTHFSLLHRHVDLLVAIHEAPDGLPESRLHDMLGGGETEASRTDIQTLSEARIIEPRPAGNLAWQLSPATRSYMAHVLQRGAMTSPDSVVASVLNADRRVRAALDLMEGGRVAEGVEELRDVIDLVDGIRTVSEQLGDVIVARAVELKARAMAVGDRFRRIQRMWEEIVLPLYQHVAPDGVIETTMQSMAHTVEHTLLQPPHPDAGGQAEALAGAISRARQAASRSFVEAYREVIRLYEDPRNRERIELGVEIIVAQMLTDGVASLDLPRTMPITTFRMSNLMDDGAAARIIHGIAEAGENEPEPMYDPDLELERIAPPPPPLRIPPVRDAMAAIVKAAAADGRSFRDIVSAYVRMIDTPDRRHEGRRSRYHYGDLVIEAPVIELTKGI